MAANGRALLEGFFASATQRLGAGGQVALTLKNQHYVSQWEPVDAAHAAGLRLVSVTEFQQAHYPGYGHVTTSAGARAPDATGGVTFIFARA